MKRLLRALDAKDLSAMVGLLLVCIGAYRIYPPAAYLIAGLFFLVLAMWRVK